jgi:hypothetical protein
MAALQPLDHAVPDWPAAVLREEEARIVGHGGAVPLGEAADGNVRLYGADGALLALARCRTGTAMPFRVFSGGEEADASRR